MAASIGNAIKNLIESGGLGVAAYRDFAGDDELKPYVTITEGLATTPEGYDDGGKSGHATELVQVDLWEEWKDEDGVIVEDPALTVRLIRLLHGAQLKTAPTRVYGVSVVSRRRLGPDANNTVHNAITANIRRVL